MSSAETAAQPRPEGGRREPAERPRIPTWLTGVGPLLLAILVLAIVAVVAGQSLGERNGPPIEEVVVERTVLDPGEIALTLRNDGPDPVQVSQVIVNDAVAQFSGASQELGRLRTETLRIRQPWVEGESYEVALLTSTGATITHEIPVAVRTPDADAGFYGLMALIGIYVGVIPVALGMLWLPWVRRMSRDLWRGVMALTIGLLAFLAVDAVLEGLELGAEGSQALGGTALVWIGVLVAYLVLSGVSSWMAGRQAKAKAGGASGVRVATLIATGIGLHNLGEGVAIGSAYSTGALALGAFLIIGFAIHNTTEGLAIVGPLAGAKPSPARLVSLGLLAGAPAVLGAWIGAAAFNASIAAFLFGFGAGAVIQVIGQLLPMLRDDEGRLLHPGAVAGLLAGIGLMFATGLLVTG
ncbi:MAG: ZIP family metal transporter [Solirubrobacteraceae bacterium]|nr:ZIP family metal transporter [Solirubrobacteraceae bacterium]